MIDSFKGQYAFLSNFWFCSVKLDGVVYPSVENAYQAAKCLVKTDQGQFLETPARIAKRLGRNVCIRPDWEAIKVSVMAELVWYKFSHDRDLFDRLLTTNGEELVEGNWWGDTFWGVCNGVGQNHLGRILMDVRAKLKLVNGIVIEPLKEGLHVLLVETEQEADSSNY